MTLDVHGGEFWNVVIGIAGGLAMDLYYGIKQFGYSSIRNSMLQCIGG